MRWSRLLFGLVLGAALVGALWFGGWVSPPEALTRRVVAFAAVYPGPVGEAEVDPIECPALHRVHFYLVCTRDCTGVRRLMAVKGLQASLVANLGRTPPEPLSVTRHRVNTIVGREALRLDAEGARQMIGCYMRLEGLHPELILPEGGLVDVEAARQGGEDAMRGLTERLDAPDAVSRIKVDLTDRGYESEMLYWDTWRAGRPVLQLRIRLARDGQVRDLHAVQISPAGGPSEAPGDEAGSAAPAPP
jgi:hypothetical protein